MEITAVVAACVFGIFLVAQIWKASAYKELADEYRHDCERFRRRFTKERERRRALEKRCRDAFGFLFEEEEDGDG